MPILEFACLICDNRFDKLVRGVIQSGTTPSGVTCPSCGASDLRRLVSAFGVSGVWQSRAPEFTLPKAKPVSPDDPFRCIV
jgi:putative FmdB family regulatory protein